MHSFKMLTNIATTENWLNPKELWCKIETYENATYLRDHAWFMPDWAENCWIICCCSAVYVEGAGENGAAGEASGTGLEEGVGAGCLKAFYRQK